MEIETSCAHGSSTDKLIKSGFPHVFPKSTAEIRENNTPMLAFGIWFITSFTMADEVDFNTLGQKGLS